MPSIDDAVDSLCSIPDAHKDELKEFIKQLPQSFETRFYARFNPDEGLFQGDILELPVAIPGLAAAPPEGIPSIILSNACDLAQSKCMFATVAPLIALQAYREWWLALGNDDTKWVEYQVSLIKNEVTNLIYVPGSTRIVPSVVLLELANPVRLITLQASVANGLQSLSQVGYYFFLAKLAHHLLRPETADIVRS